MFIVKLVLSSVTILKVFMFMGSKGKVSKECIANTIKIVNATFCENGKMQSGHNGAFIVCVDAILSSA